jgi:hypothetical protein
VVENCQGSHSEAAGAMTSVTRGLQHLGHFRPRYEMREALAISIVTGKRVEGSEPPQHSLCARLLVGGQALRAPPPQYPTGLAHGGGGLTIWCIDVWCARMC